VQSIGQLSMLQTRVLAIDYNGWSANRPYEKEFGGSFLASVPSMGLMHIPASDPSFTAALRIISSAVM
jgi:hypothetical protein